MAITVPLDRMRPYGVVTPGHTMQMMVSASASNAPPGTLLTGSSTGLARFTSNNVIDVLLIAVADTTLLPQLTGTAIPFPVILAIPHVLWEGTFVSNSPTTVSNSDFTKTYATQDTAGGFAAIDNTTADGAAPNFAARLINYVSVTSAVRLNQFSGRADTGSTTSWNVNFPQRTKGITGDTNPRVIFSWNPASTFV